MEMFNTKMDEVMINNKMIGEIMNTNDVQHDTVVEEMKNALQQEIALQEKNKMEMEAQVAYNKNKAENDKFMD